MGKLIAFYVSALRGAHSLGDVSSCGHSGGIPTGFNHPAQSWRVTFAPTRVTSHRKYINSGGNLCKKSFQRSRWRGDLKAIRIPRENQPTFFGLGLHWRGATNQGLEIIALEVEFGEVEARVAALLRAMILERLHGLSDPQAEEPLKDRLSYQRFVQLDTPETVPDESTTCRLRQWLIACGPQAQAACTGQVPDTDACYTHKYSRSYYGYKAHVSSGGDHQPVRTAVRYCTLAGPVIEPVVVPD